MVNENRNMNEVSEFFDDLPNAIFELNFDIITELAKFTYLNKVAKKFLLNIIDSEELTTGFKMQNIFGSPEQFVNLKKAIQKLIEVKEMTIKNQEYIVNTKNKRKIVIQTNYQAKLLPDNIILIRGILLPKSEIIEEEHDHPDTISVLSKERKAENLRSFFENYDAIIMILNEEGCIQFISPDVGENILYKPRDEIIGRKLEDIFPVGQSEFFYTHFREAINKGETIDFEYHLPIVTKLRWFQSRIIPVLIKDGKFMQVVAIIRDITKLRVKPLDEF
ncbi:MAG: PAS domain-containing protein [Candidatus Heimdallarchaeota archaeon]|nr:PAS domain-containing protein [Candidatus Heimdallarchaeota archaeon]